MTVYDNIDNVPTIFFCCVAVPTTTQCNAYYNLTEVCTQIRLFTLINKDIKQSIRQYERSVLFEYIRDDLKVFYA